LYNAVFIDQERYPAFAVELSGRFIFVGDKRERYTIFLNKFLVGLNGIVTYTQYLGIEAFKFLNILLEGLQFAFSDRREISKVKGEHHIFLTPVILQTDRPFVRDGFKLGSFITNLQRCG
jgi:hypothetical protein